VIGCEYRDQICDNLWQVELYATNGRLPP
jgi:hypothetical protein